LNVNNDNDDNRSMTDVCWPHWCASGTHGQTLDQYFMLTAMNVARVYLTTLTKQEAFEKCWAHSPLRAAARPNFTLPFTRCRYCRTPSAHRCPRQRRRRQQRQRVTEGTAMAP